ncbi:MAG: TetR/AcrR family transcriptional regulator [Spirochaetales bacterium]
MPKILDNVRERLLSELEAMLREEGENVSLRRLAERAGVAVGTIYNYFPDKEELVQELFERDWRRTIARAREAVAAAGAASALDTGGEAARSHPRLYAMIGAVYDAAGVMVRSKQSGRKLFTSMHRGSRQERITPYPFRAEGWSWAANEMTPLWVAVFGSTPRDAERLAVLLICTVHRLLSIYPDARERNVEFLSALIMNGVQRNESE